MGQEQIQIKTESLPETVLLNELSGHIDLHAWPDLDELCIEEGITIDELPAVIERKTANLKERELNLGRNPEDLTEILFLYKCYQALKNQKISQGKIEELKKDFSTSVSFQEKYMGSFQNKAEWRKAITYWYNEVNPRNMITVGKVSTRSKKVLIPVVYRTKDELNQKWVRMGKEGGDKGTTYVTEDVYEELTDPIRKNESFFEGCGHATTSAALDGISKHKALLSRSRLAELGDSAVSGERADPIPKVYVQEHLNYGLQYSDISWFNEFPVDIELDKRKTYPLRDIAPDHGISLGHEVPIDAVSALYAPSSNKTELEGWKDKNCPNAKVHSYEAYDCYRSSQK